MSEPSKTSQDFATQIKSNSRHKNHGLVVQMNESSCTEGIDLPMKLPNSKEREEEEYPSTFATIMSNLFMMLNPKEEQSFADQIKSNSSNENDQLFKRGETKKKSILERGEKTIHYCDTQYQTRIETQTSKPLIMSTPEKKHSFADQIKSNPRYAKNQLLKRDETKKKSMSKRAENATASCDTQYQTRIETQTSKPFIMPAPEKKHSFADQIKSNPRYAKNQLLKRDTSGWGKNIVT